MAEVSLRAQSLSFSYPSSSSPILDRVSFHITAGFTGLVGENGAGKSTLLSLVAGLLSPESGELLIEPSWATIALCPQVVDEPSSAIVELASAPGSGARRFRGQLSLEGPCLSALLEGRWAELSPGERKRWQIGAALHAEPDVLLLDEPTNHLDAEARGLLIGALSRFRGLGLVVSHDRALLEALTTATLRVASGTARLHAGAYGSAREAWEAEAAGERARRERLRAEERSLARRLEAERRELSAASAQVSAGRRMKSKHDSDARSALARGRAEYASARLGQTAASTRNQLERVAEERASIVVEREVGRSVFVGYEPPPRPRLLSIDAPGLSAGGREVLGPVKLWLDRGARVRVEGPNGAGKSTLLRALLASSTLPEGRVLYLPQELTQAEGRRLLEGVRALSPEPRGRALSLLAALGCDPDRLLGSPQPSPGEARKLSIALGLARHAWLLALDEPTNHLDLPSIERLERALEGYPGALLLVTHDQAFAAGVTDTCWRVEAGAVRGLEPLLSPPVEASREEASREEASREEVSRAAASRASSPPRRSRA